MIIITFFLRCGRMAGLPVDLWWLCLLPSPLPATQQVAEQGCQSEDMRGCAFRMCMPCTWSLPGPPCHPV